jgi:putative chitinase
MEMAYNISVAQLSKFAPDVKDSTKLNQLVQAINTTMDRFDISTASRRVRYFMAQTSFETSGFTRWEEDLIYETPERLVEVWPSRFSMKENYLGREYAPDFVNAPEKLANVVYAKRGGNGDATTGDGYAYRGRGGLDLTYLNNYRAASLYIYNDPSVYLNNPDLVAAPTDAFLSAGWFWKVYKINTMADVDSFTQATRTINGSTDTVAERLPVLDHANAVFTW